jgi:acyl-CoA thioester hydrolase
VADRLKWFHAPVRVAWSDTDAAGIVWFGMFCRYLEVAEAALFEAAGRPIPAFFADHPILMPRTELRCLFRSPARFDDVLDVALAVESATERRIRFAYAITQTRDGKLVSEGSYEIACVDKTTFKGRPFPAEVTVIFEKVFT